MPLAAGQTFAGFTIVRALGAGGMGEVYLAEHPRLPRRDALKVLPAAVSADPEYRVRFEREAELAATLWHPHIVGVHDRGESDGQLWLSMDYVDGLDAAKLLTGQYRSGMPPALVAEIVTAVASALDYAHHQGLLHRDVKPANIMLTHPHGGDGSQRILLADFGVARRLDEASGLTATNTAMGSVDYSAPEQLLGYAVDGRADQYSLAATAYHLLTGRTMFPVGNAAAVIGHHLTSPAPPLGAHRPELAALDAVLAVALAKQPSDRYRTCSDFARAFSAALFGTGVPPTAPTRPSRTPWAVLAARAASIALLAGVLLWHPWHHHGDAPTNATAPSSVVSPDAGRCARVDVPLHELEPHSPAEPRLALPQPHGWTFTTKLNSELIRGSVINTRLRANGFAPNAVVTLENLTGTAASADEALSLERDGIIANIGPVDTETPRTICGYPALAVAYTLQGRPVNAVAVAGVDERHQVWAATVSMQTTEPDNPDYIAARAAILGGFQFMLADADR